MSKLYHASFNCDYINIFKPQIPKNRHSYEDFKIPRICLSNSIEGCLTGMPNGGISLSDMCYEEGSNLLRIYEFNKDKIISENILYPNQLYKKDLVRDALISQEHWVVKQFLTPIKSYLIKIIEYEECCIENMSYKDYSKGIGIEKKQGYYNWENVINEHLIAIKNLIYEIVPEERRSKVFKLNHEITGINEENRLKIESKIELMFADIGTWVIIEKNNKMEYFLVGQLNTRYTGEYDKKDIIDYINNNLEEGKIIKN